MGNGTSELTGLARAGQNGKFSGPKGLKKVFLVGPKADRFVDGEDTGGAHEESVCTLGLRDDAHSLDECSEFSELELALDGFNFNNKAVLRGVVTEEVILN